MKKGQKGKGKDYLETLKDLKKLCIKYYGLGFIFATPKVRAILMETMNEFIDDLVNALAENKEGEKNDK